MVESKLEDVRTRSRKWAALFRTGYFGRNLVVQAMFLGRLLYWFFSLPMPHTIVRMIQSDADILWWSKEPSLKACRKTKKKTVFDVS